MPNLRIIEIDSQRFLGVPAVVRYLQATYKHGTDFGLRGAIERGKSTYLGHAIKYEHKADDGASTFAPNAPKRRGEYIPTHRYLGLPPLLRIPH